MNQKNRYTTNSNINNPLPNSEFYISESDRLFGDNFATGEYLRRKQENEKKKEKYKFRQNQLFERERKRWEKLDYEYLRKENQNMMNKERNLVGRKNNPGMAFNPLNLQYDNSVQGEILKRRDEESKYRSWLRSMNIDKHSNTGYNIINGEERTILEERLNKDIVPDLIQKNIDQINEMKNKVVFNYNNFYTRCNPSSPDLKSYRYDNNNSNNYYNGNRINRSTNTPNMVNNNGGRFRAPVDLRNERNLYDNGVARSNNMLRGNNNLNIYNNNNDYDNMNRNNFSPQPRENQYERNDMNNNNFYNNDRNNMNINNNMNMGDNMNNNMNNNFNNNNFNNNNDRNNDMNMNNNNNYYGNERNDMMNNNNNNNNNEYNDRNRNITPNVGIIDLNNMNTNNNQNERNNNMYPENNNTLNNNFRNNNMNMNNQNMNDNNGNNMNRTPNKNNFVENGNNIMGGKNDFYYKGNQTDVNSNSNLNQRQNVQDDYQGQPQSNYGVNPYNPYSRPDFYMMSK